MECNKEITLVLVHGNSSSSNIYAKVTKYLNKYCRVVTLDLPGHGSNKSQDNNFLLSNFSNFLISEINKIQGNKLLVGHSFGGHLIVGIAKHIKNLKGILIFGASLLKKPVNLQEAFLPSKSDNNALFKDKLSDSEINETIDVLLHVKEHTSFLIKEFKNTNSSVRTAIINGIISGSYEEEYIAFLNLNKPKYIILSEYDSVPNPAYLKAVAKECGKLCKLYTIKNSGHYPMLEQPEQFINVIKDVLKEI